MSLQTCSMNSSWEETTMTADKVIQGV